MHTASIIRSVMLGKSVPGVIPRELLTTDRILQRWAASNGTGLPTELWDDRRKSKPPELDDETALIVDHIVETSPPRTRRLVKGWYCRPIPTAELAREMHMSARSIEKAHVLTLNFLKWKFERAGHSTLLKLLRMVV
jgi:hypothetical protein